MRFDVIVAGGDGLLMDVLKYQKSICISHTEILIQCIKLLRLTTGDGISFSDANHCFLIKDCSIITEKGELLIRGYTDMKYLAIIGEIRIVAIISTLTCECLGKWTHDVIYPIRHHICHRDITTLSVISRSRWWRSPTSWSIVRGFKGLIILLLELLSRSSGWTGSYLGTGWGGCYSWLTSLWGSLLWSISGSNSLLELIIGNVVELFDRSYKTFEKLTISRLESMSVDPMITKKRRMHHTLDGIIMTDVEFTIVKSDLGMNRVSCLSFILTFILRIE